MNQFAVEKAVRQGMAFTAIVDIGGKKNPKTGGFHVPQDALDAGHQSIFIRDGTYPSFDVDGNHNTIVGESWNTIIDGTDEADYAVHVDGGTGNKIFNLAAKLDGGGGTAKETFYINGNFGVVSHCQVQDADHYGIITYKGQNHIVFNEIATGDDHQVFIASHKNVVIGNIVNSDSAGLGIYLTGDNNIVIGNMSMDTIQTAVGADYNNVSANLTDIAVTNAGANNEVGGANKVF